MLALGGVALALWFFTANDDATTSGPPVSAPGTVTSDPGRYARELQAGNVVLEVMDAGTAPAAQALARSVAGPEDAALRAAGQAVIVDDAGIPQRSSGSPAELGTSAPTCASAGSRTIDCPAVIAHAHGRALAAPSADDPRLRAFVEYWLGRAAG